MEANLIIVGGKASKPKIALKLPSIIGRGKEADVTVAHPMISRQHCKLFEKDGLLMLLDLGSLNGTLVGDKLVKQAPLPPNSEFTVGPLTFKTEYEYKGDLSKLPAVMPAENKAKPAAAADDESPDFEIFSEPAVTGEANLADDAFAEIVDGDDSPTPIAEKEKPAAPDKKKKKGWFGLGKKDKAGKEKAAEPEEPAKPDAKDEAKAAKVEKKTTAKPAAKPAASAAKAKQEKPAAAPAKPKTSSDDDDMFAEFLNELE